MFCYLFFFFFNDPATTDIYTYLHTLSLPDPLPIYCAPLASGEAPRARLGGPRAALPADPRKKAAPALRQPSFVAASLPDAAASSAPASASMSSASARQAITSSPSCRTCLSLRSLALSASVFSSES